MVVPVEVHVAVTPVVVVTVAVVVVMEVMTMTVPSLGVRRGQRRNAEREGSGHCGEGGSLEHVVFSEGLDRPSVWLDGTPARFVQALAKM